MDRKKVKKQRLYVTLLQISLSLAKSVRGPFKKLILPPYLVIEDKNLCNILCSNSSIDILYRKGVGDDILKDMGFGRIIPIPLGQGGVN